MRIIILIMFISLWPAIFYSCSSEKNKNKKETQLHWPPPKVYLKGLGFINGPFKEIKETIDNGAGKIYHNTYLLDTALQILTKIDTDNDKKEYIYLNNNYRSDSSVEESASDRITYVYWQTPFYEDKILYIKRNNIKTDSFYYTIDSSNKSRPTISCIYYGNPAERTIDYYDKGFFVESRTVTLYSALKVKWLYRYDKNGNILSQRLEGKAGGFETNAQYSGYDNKGNWTEKEEVFNSFPQGEKTVMSVRRTIIYE